MHEAEVHLSQGKTVGQACKALGSSEGTCYRWRREYGGMDLTQARKLKEMEKEHIRLKKLVTDLSLDNAILKEVLDVSERRACRVVGQPRSTQRYHKQPADDEEFLTARIIELASQYGRFGYRRVAALLRNESWIERVQITHGWSRYGVGRG